MSRVPAAVARDFLHRPGCPGERALEATSHGEGQTTVRCLDCGANYLSVPGSAEAEPARSDDELAAAAAEAPRLAGEAAKAAAKLAEVQARKDAAADAGFERMERRGEEYDRARLAAYDRGPLEEAEKAARAAFAAAVVEEPWAKAWIAARAARGRLVALSTEARGLHERFGDPNTPTPTEWRWWQADLAADLLKVLDAEASRQVAEDYDAAKAEREGFVEG